MVVPARNTAHVNNQQWVITVLAAVTRMQKHRSQHREEQLVLAHGIREKSSLQQAWQDKASLGQQLLLLLITIPGSKELN